MIGLYAIGVVLLWLWLTWLLLRFGWRSLTQAREKSLLRNLPVMVIILAWFGASFWYGGGRIIYYDWRVNRMCSVDGGVRVYQTVKLPEEMFDKWGMVNFYRPNQGEESLGKDYVFVGKTTVIRNDNPRIWSDQYQVYQRKSMKLLGETISYSRLGGDVPGPWHKSSFGCPQGAGDASLIRQIFTVVK